MKSRPIPKTLLKGMVMVLYELNMLFRKELSSWTEINSFRYAMAKDEKSAVIEMYPDDWIHGRIRAEYFYVYGRGWEPVAFDLFAPDIDVGSEAYEGLCVGCRVTLLVHPHIIAVPDMQPELFLEIMPSRTGKASQKLLSGILDAEKEHPTWL